MRLIVGSVWLALALWTTVSLADAGQGRWKALEDEVEGARRSAAKVSSEGGELTRYARSLGMPGAAIDNPCVRFVGGDCAQTALDPFFASLDAARAKSGQARAVVLGNSLIASDHIVDVVRQRLVEVAGDAGKGFLLTDRMAPYGRRDRTGHNAKGWDTYNISMGEFGPYPHGVSGVLHVSNAAARTTWKSDGATRGRVFWLDDKGAQPFKIEGGGKTLLEVSPAHRGRSMVSEFAIPVGANEVTLTTSAAGTVVYGATFEKATPGFTLDTMGVVSVDASIFLKEDEKVFAQQLQALNPSMVALLLGGNEIKRVKWGRRGLATVRKDLTTFFNRVHTTAPDASCLVIGPLENLYGADKPDPFKTRPETRLVNETLHKMSVEHGCAYFDLFAAMGEEGALKRLNDRGLMHEDLVHPRAKGLDVSGELIADAILAAYNQARLPAPVASLKARWEALGTGVVKAARGTREDPARLDALGRQLLDLDARKARRVALAMSLPKGQEAKAFADSLSSMVKRRFGDRGRGLVAGGDDDVPATMKAGQTWEAPYEIGASFVDVYWRGAPGSLGFKRAWSKKRKASVDDKKLSAGIVRSRVRLPPRDRIVLVGQGDVELIGVAVEPDDWRGVVMDRARGSDGIGELAAARPSAGIIAFVGVAESATEVNARLAPYLDANPGGSCLAVLPTAAATAPSSLASKIQERCGFIVAADALPGRAVDDGALAKLAAAAIFGPVDAKTKIAVRGR